MPQELTAKQATPIDAFRHQMTKMVPEFAMILPPHMTEDKLFRTVVTAVQNNKKLLEADRNTLFSAIMTGAALGLEMDGVTGQGFLVPYKGQVAFIPGYKGYVTLAYNSGFVLEGHVVHANDDFSYQYGSDPKILHAPARSALGHKPGGVTAAYATARSSSAPTALRVMELDELMEVRNNSSGFKAMGNRSPWVTNFDAMCIKTAVRRLGANLPLNVQRLAALDQAFDDGGRGEITKDGELNIIDVEADAAVD